MEAPGGYEQCQLTAKEPQWPTLVESDFIAPFFILNNGEIIQELKLHYRTIGTLRRNGSGRATNAVLIMHGTGGSGAQFLVDQFAGELFGPGQLLDAQKYFVILRDGIGHGGSSKPSDGMHVRFPRYGYTDMIRADYDLLTEELGVNHLRLVMGTSMGGMHSWLWGEMYPRFMDALMPLASLPIQISGRNRMFRKMIHDAITGDPKWRGGEYARGQQPRQGLTTALYILTFMSSVPLLWQKEAPDREAADAFLDKRITAGLETTDANDLLYQVDASYDYDPQSRLGEIIAPVLAINSADDQVNPPELGVLQREMENVRRGRVVILSISEETKGHGSHTWARLWKGHLEALLEQTEQRDAK